MDCLKNFVVIIIYYVTGSNYVTKVKITHMMLRLNTKGILHFLRQTFVVTIVGTLRIGVNRRGNGRSSRRV